MSNPHLVSSPSRGTYQLSYQITSPQSPDRYISLVDKSLWQNSLMVKFCHLLRVDWVLIPRRFYLKFYLDSYTKEGFIRGSILKQIISVLTPMWVLLRVSPRCRFFGLYIGTSLITGFNSMRVLFWVPYEFFISDPMLTRVLLCVPYQ